MPPFYFQFLLNFFIKFFYASIIVLSLLNIKCVHCTGEENKNIVSYAKTRLNITKIKLKEFHNFKITCKKEKDFTWKSLKFHKNVYFKISRQNVFNWNPNKTKIRTIGLAKVNWRIALQKCVII